MKGGGEFIALSVRVSAAKSPVVFSHLASLENGLRAHEARRLMAIGLACEKSVGQIQPELAGRTADFNPVPRPGSNAEPVSPPKQPAAKKAAKVAAEPAGAPKVVTASVSTPVPLSAVPVVDPPLGAPPEVEVLPPRPATGRVLTEDQRAAMAELLSLDGPPR